MNNPQRTLRKLVVELLWERGIGADKGAFDMPVIDSDTSSDLEGEA